jgi:protein kinase A
MEAFLKVQPRKIKLGDYQLDRTLGTGSFGRVKLSKHKTSGKFVAIKILKKAEIIKLKQVDHIMNEIRILTMIDHPFLVKTDGFTQDEKYIYVVLELVNGGELFTYLRGVGKFPVDQAW